MILLLWQHINLGHLLTWFLWKVQHQNLQVGWVTHLLCLYEACVVLVTQVIPQVFIASPY
jgi:hypothetical protein